MTRLIEEDFTKIKSETEDVIKKLIEPNSIRWQWKPGLPFMPYLHPEEAEGNFTHSLWTQVVLCVTVVCKDIRKQDIKPTNYTKTEKWGDLFILYKMVEPKFNKQTLDKVHAQYEWLELIVRYGCVGSLTRAKTQKR